MYSQWTLPRLTRSRFWRICKNGNVREFEIRINVNFELVMNCYCVIHIDWSHIYMITNQHTVSCLPFSPQLSYIYTQRVFAPTPHNSQTWRPWWCSTRLSAALLRSRVRPPLSHGFFSGEFKLRVPRQRQTSRPNSLCRILFKKFVSNFLSHVKRITKHWSLKKQQIALPKVVVCLRD